MRRAGFSHFLPNQTALFARLGSTRAMRRQSLIARSVLRAAINLHEGTLPVWTVLPVIISMMTGKMHAWLAKPGFTQRMKVILAVSSVPLGRINPLRMERYVSSASRVGFSQTLRNLIAYRVRLVHTPAIQRLSLNVPCVQLAHFSTRRTRSTAQNVQLANSKENQGKLHAYHVMLANSRLSPVARSAKIVQ